MEQGLGLVPHESSEAVVSASDELGRVAVVSREL